MKGKIRTYANDILERSATIQEIIQVKPTSSSSRSSLSSLSRSSLRLSRTTSQLPLPSSDDPYHKKISSASSSSTSTSIYNLISSPHFIPSPDPSSDLPSSSLSSSPPFNPFSNNFDENNNNNNNNNNSNSNNEKKRGMEGGAMRWRQSGLEVLKERKSSVVREMIALGIKRSVEQYSDMRGITEDRINNDLQMSVRYRFNPISVINVNTTNNNNNTLNNINNVNNNNNKNGDDNNNGIEFEFEDFAPLTFKSIRSSTSLPCPLYLLSLLSSDDIIPRDDDHNNNNNNNNNNNEYKEENKTKEGRKEEGRRKKKWRGYKNKLVEMASKGRSGSFFFKTKDHKLVIKSLYESELIFFRSLLPSYSEYLLHNHNSLIARIFGLHSIYQDGFLPIHFIVMENLLPLPLSSSLRVLLSPLSLSLLLSL